MKFALNYDYPPAADFSDLFGTFDRLISSAPAIARTSKASGLPADFYESDSGFHLLTELPGAKRDDIGIEVESRVLTLSHGDKKRGFQLPEAADAEAVSATFEDGNLTITIGRAEETKARAIEIN